ncbi:MAG: hypothetical protein JWL76_2000 [Thermoleophilia bacterium]|nr:hypothetical protein [Thermoleophilia bacterium]
MKTTIHNITEALERIDAFRQTDLGQHATGGNELLSIMVAAHAREHEEQLRMSELASRVSMSRAAVTSLVDRMEARGVFKRVPGTDRRVTFIELTDVAWHSLREAQGAELEAVA